MRIFTAPTVICQLIVAAYFYHGFSCRRDAERLLPHTIVSPPYASSLPKGIEGMREGFAQTNDDDSRKKSPLGASSLSFSLSSVHPFVRSSIVLRPSLFLRPWPMNADPLMRADLAGLTRPDGCFWNPGTLARARNEQNRGLNRQRELDILDDEDDGEEEGEE